MKLKELSKEELEVMSYDDIAFLILKEEKQKMKIHDLFKKVCSILNLSESVFENQIADFFEILTTDKRFTMVEDGYWDLKERHRQAVVIDDDDDEGFVDEESEDEEETVEEEKNFYDEEEEDNGDDDLKDLVVIDEEEEGESL